MILADAGRLRQELADARDVCRRLGLDEGAKPQGRGLIIRCPWHADKTPSCSVREAADGTLSVHCFACDHRGDVLDLVAVVNGIDCQREFRRVLRLASDLAGSALEDPRPRQHPVRRPEVRGDYPPFDEVAKLWASCRPVLDDPPVVRWLCSRGLDPGAVEASGVARALPIGMPLPRWARCGGRTWSEAGYRCVLSMFDERGDLRSVRVRRVVEGQGPKALPPTGHRIGGLVMAESFAQRILKTGKWPDCWSEAATPRIVIAEGEPDFLTWAGLRSDADEDGPLAFGIVAGSWTVGIAARVPTGSRVVIRTDHDPAGEKYADVISASLAGRVSMSRGGALSCDACIERSRGAA